jgi:hypothetical protein
MSLRYWSSRSMNIHLIPQQTTYDRSRCNNVSPIPTLITFEVLGGEEAEQGMSDGIIAPGEWDELRAMGLGSSPSSGAFG